MRKINIPFEVEKIINDLNQKKFEAYIVGGCVRDCMLGKNPKDWDITTNAKPTQIKNIFEKTVDTGIAHGTVTVILNKKHFEVTTYRIDGNYKDCRRPENVFFTDDLIKDLSRRDFTMNAIAYNKKNGYIDPFCGQNDIKNKTIRCVGNSQKRFNEDALRIMRALRFACQLNFHIENETYTAIKKNSALIKFVSIERIRDEIVKLLSAQNLDNLHLLIDSQILKFVNSELHNYMVDNFKCIYENLLRTEKSCDIIFSALLYKMSSNMAYEIMRFFRFDNKTCDTVKIILKWLYVGFEITPYFIKKVIASIGYINFYKLLKVKKIVGIDDVEKIKSITGKISTECVFIRELAVDGNDIKSLGFTENQIGSVLDYLLDIVHKFPKKNSFDDLISLAKSYPNKI